MVLSILVEDEGKGVQPFITDVARVGGLAALFRPHAAQRWNLRLTVRLQRLLDKLNFLQSTSGINQYDPFTQ